MIELIVLNALFALIFPLSKLATQYAPLILTTGIRMCFAGCLLVGYKIIKGESFIPILRSYQYLVPLTLFNIFFNNVFAFWSLPFVSVGKTTFIFNWWLCI